MVGAVVRRDLAAAGRVLEDDVDHAGNRIGTVLRTGAIAQHFDAFDRADRNGVEVDGRGAVADLGIGVDQGRGMEALAVHQHQHFIRRQPAQLGRTYVVRSARVGLARKIERRQQHRERRAQFAVHRAGIAQILLAQHVDGHGRVQRGAIAGAHAGDHHLVQRLGLRIAGLRLRIRHRCGQRTCHENGEQADARWRGGVVRHDEFLRGATVHRASFGAGAREDEWVEERRRSALTVARPDNIAAWASHAARAGSQACFPSSSTNLIPGYCWQWAGPAWRPAVICCIAEVMLSILREDKPFHRSIRIDVQIGMRK